MAKDAKDRKDTKEKTSSVERDAIV